MRTISERRANDRNHIIKEFKKVYHQSKRYAKFLTNNGKEMNRLNKVRVYIGCPEGHSCEWCQRSSKKQLHRAEDRQKEIMKDGGIL